jgi:AraC-like DNA-binding protein
VSRRDLRRLRNEKNSNWEGAFRVPTFVRWPGHIRPGQVSNEMLSGLDWFPTLLAAAGDTSVKERLLAGWPVGGTTYKVHLDGYNQLPYLTGQQDKSERKEFFYFNDDGQLVALRYENWKMVFCEQRVEGTLRVWAEPFVCLRLPEMYNLRMDPYERAGVTSNTYYEYLLERAFLAVPTQAIVGQFIGTFRDFPPRQRPSSFSVDQIMDQIFVARSLGMSQRTLAQKLADEGLNFTEILQQLRRDLAVRYLDDRKLHVSKIVEGLDLHHLYRAMAWLGEELSEKEQDGRTPFSPRCLKDVVEERLFAHLGGW